MTNLRKIALTMLRLGIAYFAFSLSFVAQTTLAHASGITTDLAWQYPLIVDAAILFGMLVDAWSNNGLTKGQRQYLYLAIGFWTTTSILGNAFHLTALPSNIITVPIGLAVAVNTVPGVTLFLMIHLSSRVRPTQTPRHPGTRKTSPPRSRPTGEAQAVRAPRTVADTRGFDVAELVAANDAGESLSKMALRLGVPKSTLGGILKSERDRRMMVG
jgi:hypothetical protein